MAPVQLITYQEVAAGRATDRLELLFGREPRTLHAGFCKSDATKINSGQFPFNAAVTIHNTGQKNSTIG